MRIAQQRALDCPHRVWRHIARIDGQRILRAFGPLVVHARMLAAGSDNPGLFRCGAQYYAGVADTDAAARSQPSAAGHACAAIPIARAAARPESAVVTDTKSRGIPMTYQLIASPYPEGHLASATAGKGGIRIGASRYDELRDATPAAPVPHWLVAAARAAWGLDVNEQATGTTIMVRPETAYGYARASYELNVGCNYDFFWINGRAESRGRGGCPGPRTAVSRRLPW